jgi:hypothetical protein
VNPTLAWSRASEQWGLPSYQVKVDGALVAQTTATSITVPTPLRQGRHAWQISAVNRAGAATVARSGAILVDSLAPTVKLRVTGQRNPRRLLHASIRAYDTRPGLPGRQVSGVASVQVKWGDGFKPFVRSTSTSTSAHAYRRRGSFLLTVIVFDRAGNRTVVTKKIRITAPGKKPGKGKPSRRTHAPRQRSRR